MQSFILPLLFILFSSGTAIIISKKKFEEVLPFSLMISMLLVFIFAYFDHMLIGFYLSIFIALLFPFLLIYSFIKKKGVEVLKKFFTPSFIIFLAIYLFILILNRNRGFTGWDEISHWGPMVKEMLRLDMLYSVPESALIAHKDYPPIVPIFEYIWCKLSGNYQESYVYSALQILSFSLFFPALKNFKWKKGIGTFLKLFLITVLILCSVQAVSVGEANFYKTVYIDCFVGLMFAHSMFLVLSFKRFSLFEIARLLVVFSTLILTKQIGLVFYFLSLGFFGLICFYINSEYRFNWKLNHERIKKIIYILILLVVPISFFFGWSKFVDVNKLETQFKISDINVTEVYGIIKGSSGEVYQRETYKNFVNMLVSTPLITRPIPFAYWQIAFLSILIWIGFSQYTRKLFDINRIHILNVLIFLGSIVYTFVMLLLYLFNFSVREALIVTCYSRYMNTYWFAVLGLLVMVFLYITDLRDKKFKVFNNKALLLFLLLLFVGFIEPSKLYDFKPPTVYTSVVDEYREHSDIINTNTEENSKIYVVSQGGCFIGYGLTYLVLPRQLNNSIDTMSLGVPYCDIDGFGIFKPSIDEVIEDLTNYNYLYLHNIDDYFISNYSSIFPEGSMLKEKQLYRIGENNQFSLELIVEK